MSTTAAAGARQNGSGGLPGPVSEEFDRQLSTLLAKGYPQAAGLSTTDFVALVEPLRESLLTGSGDGEAGDRIPFVVVIKRELVPSDRAIELVERRGESGFSVFEPDDLRRFEPIEQVTLPEGPAYLLLDVDTGPETRNVTPDDAMVTIERLGRSPLTVEEGIALVTHQPEAVAKSAGFSLAGSRCGDRRVTALWISQNRPKLGWCWAGNPHTWLGTASCGRRLA